MRIILLSLLLTFFALLGFACGGGASGNGSTGSAGGSPTETYKQLYAAVKSKNTDSIKQFMSKQTQEFAVMVSQRQNSPVDKVYENGFTATTFAEALPEIRDERVEGSNAAIEVWNNKENKWEDLPFVKEETGWKLAVGDLFKGSWTSPGKGRAVKEMEAANAAGGGPQMGAPVNSNTNTNAMNNTKIQIPKPKAQ